jgi:hypothetical protein
MTLSDCLAVSALVVAALGLAVSLASVVIARGAKQQAKQAALLERRAKAIKHVRQAYDAIDNNRFVADEDLKNLREAQLLSELAFGPKAQEALDEAFSTARRLNSSPPDQRKVQDFRDKLDRLGEDLRALLTRMNEEAALDL